MQRKKKKEKRKKIEAAIKIWPLEIWIGLFAALIFLACENSPKESSNHCQNIKECLLVGTSDFTESSLSTIDINTLQVTKDLLTPHSDFVLREIHNQPYIINRQGADNITRLSASDYSQPIFEQSVGRQSNPADLEVWEGDLGLVGLGSTNHLLVIDLESGRIHEDKTIDISSYNEAADETSDLQGMIFHDRAIYISLADYPQSREEAWTAAWWENEVPHGKLLRVNVGEMNVENGATEMATMEAGEAGEAGEATGTRLADMPFQAPYGDMELYRGDLDDSGDKDWIILTTTGRPFSTNLDGALIAYDIANDKYKILLTEEEIGRDILEAVIVSEQLGFLVLGQYNSEDFTFNYSIHAFQPASASGREAVSLDQLYEILPSAGPSPPPILYKNSKLYVGDRTPTKPGIFIFQVADENSIAAITEENISQENREPIDVGLPPSGMLLLELE